MARRQRTKGTHVREHHRHAVDAQVALARVQQVVHPVVVVRPLHAVLVDARAGPAGAVAASGTVVGVAALAGQPVAAAVGHVGRRRQAGARQAGGRHAVLGAHVQVAVVDVEPRGVQRQVDAVVEARLAGAGAGARQHRRRN